VRATVNFSKIATSLSMTATSEEFKNKLGELIIDEAEVHEALIDRVKQVIRLTKKGKVVFVKLKDRLSVRTQVALYLLGRWLANQAGFTECEVSTIDEIASALSADYFTVTARLNEPKREGVATVVERADTLSL